MARFTRNALGSAFYAWERETKRSRVFRRNARVAERFVLAVAHRAARRAFEGWREKTRRFVAAETTARRTLQRLLQKTTAHFFYDWLDVVNETKRAAEKAERAEKLWRAKLARCDRFAAAMLHRSLARAWARWVERAAEAARARATLSLIHI